MINKNHLTVATLVAGLALLVGCRPANAADGKDQTASSSEASISTNDNGTVSRTFVESSVTTNGNMVTERRRETRTSTDAEGNLLATSTSEYAQSYSLGETLAEPAPAAPEKPACDKAALAPAADSFLGVKFGEEVPGVTNFVRDAAEPTLLRATFTPAKGLAGFDDYYVYVTPTTHKAAKVYACAKEPVEPGQRWGRHYLIEALEKRYNTWARLSSFNRPLYSFRISPERYVKLCLLGSTPDYETVILAADEAMLQQAADEQEEIREAARKNAVEKRARRVSDAAEAF